MAVEWNERQLCPEGSCIGVIGADGTCKVCGRTVPGGARVIATTSDEAVAATADVAHGEDDELEDDDDYEDDDEDEDEGAEKDAETAAADGDRALCPDGGCIGLIGADGRCKVCGKAGRGAAPKPSEQELAPAALDESEADRKLCPDGACVGVIGSTGTCNICGKAAE